MLALLTWTVGSGLPSRDGNLDDVPFVSSVRPGDVMLVPFGCAVPTRFLTILEAAHSDPVEKAEGHWQGDVKQR